MTPRIVVCSIMRDGMKYLAEFLARCNRFTYPNLEFIVVEGDSTDGTDEALAAEAARWNRLHVVKHDTQSSKFGSVVRTERFRAMAASMNVALETALTMDPDHILYLTADLRVPDDLAEGLLETATHTAGTSGRDIIAPMIMRDDGVIFYDTWAFRKGRSLFLRGPGWSFGCFQMKPPYHPCYRADRAFEVDSAGSILLIPAEVIRRGARFTPDLDVVGFCREARGLGYHVWVEPGVICRHPPLGSDR